MGSRAYCRHRATSQGGHTTPPGCGLETNLGSRAHGCKPAEVQVHTGCCGAVEIRKSRTVSLKSSQIAGCSSSRELRSPESALSMVSIKNYATQKQRVRRLVQTRPDTPEEYNLLNPKPQTRNPKPETPNPKHLTLNPQPPKPLPKTAKPTG